MTHHEWTAINEASNVIGLLTIVQVCMTLRQNQKHEVHSLFDAEAFVLNYKQSKQTSNHEYYEKFKDSVATAERLCSDIGLHASRIAYILNHIAVNPDVPTAVERTIAHNTAKGEYLAICFLMNSNKVAMEDSSMTSKTKTLKEATPTLILSLAPTYDYLVNYKASRLSSNDQDKGGQVF